MPGEKLNLRKQVRTGNQLHIQRWYQVSNQDALVQSKGSTTTLHVLYLLPHPVIVHNFLIHKFCRGFFPKFLMGTKFLLSSPISIGDEVIWRIEKKKKRKENLAEAPNIPPAKLKHFLCVLSMKYNIFKAARWLHWHWQLSRRAACCQLSTVTTPSSPCSHCT